MAHHASELLTGVLTGRLAGTRDRTAAILSLADVDLFDPGVVSSVVGTAPPAALESLLATVLLLDALLEPELIRGNRLHRCQ